MKKILCSGTSCPYFLLPASCIAIYGISNDTNLPTIREQYNWMAQKDLDGLVGTYTCFCIHSLFARLCLFLVSQRKRRIGLIKSPFFYCSLMFCVNLITELFIQTTKLCFSNSFKTGTKIYRLPSLSTADLQCLGRGISNWKQSSEDLSRDPKI